jgi:hypothetical protein
MLQAGLMNIYKKSCNKSYCTSNIVVSPGTLYPTPSNSAALKTLQSTEEAHNEGNTQKAYFSNLLYSQNIGAVTNNYS